MSVYHSNTNEDTDLSSHDTPEAVRPDGTSLSTTLEAQNNGTVSNHQGRTAHTPAQPNGLAAQLEQAQREHSEPPPSISAISQGVNVVPAVPNHAAWHPPYTAHQYGPPVLPGPAIFYPPYHGMPILMNQCPRCFLRAAEPFIPLPAPAPQPPRPSRDSWMNPDAPPIPEQNALAQTQNQTQIRQSQTSATPEPRHHGAMVSHHEYAVGHPDHPNAHLYVTPDGHRPFANNPRPAPSAVYVPAQRLPTKYAAEKLEAYRKAQAEAEARGTEKTPEIDLALKRDLHNLEHPDQYLVKLPDGSTRVRKRKAPPQRAYKRRLTRDERRDILLMRKLNYTFEQIANFLGTTLSAVSYTCRQNSADVKHTNAGRKIEWPQELTARLTTFVKEHLAREKAGGFDTAKNKKNVPSLTYNMIRESVFADENGQIPDQYKKFTTDDAIKAQLNKHGLWLRQPMPAHLVEQARARGKKLWLEKLEKDRLDAEAAADAVGDIEASGPGNPSVVHGYAEVDVEDEDEDMDDAEDVNDGQISDDTEEEQDVRLRQDLSRAMVQNGQTR